MICSFDRQHIAKNCVVLSTQLQILQLGKNFALGLELNFVGSSV